MIRVLVFFTITFTHFVQTQNCVPEDISPNNPTSANCNAPGAGFFDLDAFPNNPCICCKPLFVPLPDDNPPDKCLNAPNTLTVTGTGICNTNFDCCRCEAITCNACSGFKCSGDSACIGVDDITINGNCNGQGSEIDCNGDLSCFRTKVVGECITVVKCAGDNACGESTLLINQVTQVPSGLTPITFLFDGDKSVPKSTIKAKNVIKFTCAGDGSCEQTTAVIECRNDANYNGCALELAGDNAAQNSDWTVTNANSILIKGDDGATGAKLNVDCINAGCSIIVNNERSAQSSNIKVTNANSLQCAGQETCSLATFDLTCVNSGCPISCESSCLSSTITVSQSNGIICNGAITRSTTILGSCEGATITLNNNKGGDISCSGTKACKDATITDSTANGVNKIGAINCDAANACESANIKAIARNSNFKLNCIGENCCKNGILDISTRFSLIKSIAFSSINAGNSAQLNVKASNTNRLKIETFTCSGKTSCFGLISNIQSAPGKNVDILLTCGDEQSCTNAKFTINLLGNTGSNKAKLVVICGGLDSCDGFIIEVKRNGIGFVVMDDIQATINCVAGNCDNAFLNGVPFRL